MDETAKRRNGETTRKAVRHFRDLDVYQNGLTAGLRIYKISKKFPAEERYEAAFVSKLSDAETEAAETQVHAEFAFKHDYLSGGGFFEIDDAYEKIIGQLVKMIDHPEKWLIKNAEPRR